MNELLESSEEFQPTRPLRGATVFLTSFPIELFRFQPTRPLRGATTVQTMFGINYVEFQPTRPLRGATVRSGRDDL